MGYIDINLLLDEKVDLELREKSRIWEGISDIKDINSKVKKTSRKGNDEYDKEHNNIDESYVRDELINLYKGLKTTSNGIVNNEENSGNSHKKRSKSQTTASGNEVPNRTKKPKVSTPTPEPIIKLASLSKDGWSDLLPPTTIDGNTRDTIKPKLIKKVSAPSDVRNVKLNEAIRELIPDIDTGITPRTGARAEPDRESLNSTHNTAEPASQANQKDNTISNTRFNLEAHVPENTNSHIAKQITSFESTPTHTSHSNGFLYLSGTTFDINAGPGTTITDDSLAVLRKNNVNYQKNADNGFKSPSFKFISGNSKVENILRGQSVSGNFLMENPIQSPSIPPIRKRAGRPIGAKTKSKVAAVPLNDQNITPAKSNSIQKPLIIDIENSSSNNDNNDNNDKNDKNDNSDNHHNNHNNDNDDDDINDSIIARAIARGKTRKPLIGGGSQVNLRSRVHDATFYRDDDDEFEDWQPGD